MKFSPEGEQVQVKNVTLVIGSPPQPQGTIGELEELGPRERQVAYHVIENIDAFLTRDRWLKGGWFNADDRKPGGGLGDVSHTECLANFIRRVELGGRFAEADPHARDADGNPVGGYGDEVQQSVTEMFVAKAIQQEFPRVVTRHQFIPSDQAHDEGLVPFNPKKCDQGADGGRCATCRSKMLPHEVAVAVNIGPFPGTEAGGIIPSFNDWLGVTYEDVQRVIGRARSLVAGHDPDSVPTTVASEAMTDEERIDTELQSIEAQLDIDLERIMEWSLEGRGWLPARQARVRAQKRRAREHAEKQTKAVLSRA